MLPRLLSQQPSQNLLKSEAEVAPVMGMDGTVPIFNMRSGTAIFLYNLLPSEYGCQTRPGWRTWAQNLAGGAVHSLIPFNSQVLAGTESRLFVATKEGIYDITTQGQDNPPKVVTFPDQSDQAGFCTFLHHTDPNGNQVLLVADSRNGMYEYNPQGSVWTKYTTQISGADPAKVAFLMSHKARVWVVERDSSDAWYLAVGARAGAATKFQFGSKMQHGGYLVGLYNWSQDGGDGVDDYLVAVSKAGDVLVYRGTDPATSGTWDQKGRWFIGRVPENRRVATESGGDVLLLSVFGVTSVTTLMAGVDPSKVDRNVTAKISRFVGNAVRQKIDMPYWEIKPLREQNLMVVNSPWLANESPVQYALNINRLAEESGGGWGIMRDITSTTMESYNSRTFFGTADGKVGVFAGSLDAVDITGAGGDAILFSMLGRYTNYGSSQFKQVQYIRPSFQTWNVLAIETRAVYDFNVNEDLSPVTAISTNGAQWDISNWDQAIWSGLTAISDIGGASGYGVNVAIAIRGSAITRSTLVNIDLAWQPWDFL